MLVLVDNALSREITKNYLGRANSFMNTDNSNNMVENKFQKIVLTSAAVIVVATFAYSWVCEIVIASR